MSDSLPARAYFLACDPDGGPVSRRPRAALLVRAAAVTDLVLRGNLRDERGHAEPTGAAPTGDLLLDDLLADLRAHRPASWRALLRRGKNDTLQSLETQLSAAGLLEEGSSSILHRKVLEPSDPARVRDAHARLDHALTAPLSEVDASDAALAALAGASGAGMSRSDARRHSGRLKELEQLAGPVVPALRKAVAGRRAARIAAFSGGSGG
ncbi:GPP34 family phosphoprotein [Amycolatopsis echigonensis]|uniref:GPP34 family phosphoprotein n=1 Tax=Amycolatopsis echigonensis TaxID=2576905 RepID=A0A8E2BBA5_9PSEU|nr:GPP34 family phosphoprotein [Amycolatopsis echigonensis]MBB2505983.1 GPP34 family phosphoprotein [Amycolatopsis echigonensis]